MRSVLGIGQDERKVYFSDRPHIPSRACVSNYNQTPRKRDTFTGACTSRPHSALFAPSCKVCNVSTRNHPCRCRWMESGKA